MTQKIFGLGMGGAGIVGVLIVAGIILYTLNINSGAASTAIAAGIIIGIILGALGIIGVIITLLKRI